MQASATAAQCEAVKAGLDVSPAATNHHYGEVH